MRRQHLAKQSGVVLPIALILLVIISFAGLFAARNSATHEQFSNNIRTMNLARQAAELGLRYCEAVVIDKVNNDGETFPADVLKVIEPAVPVADISAATWNNHANWLAANANLITAPVTYDANVDAAVELVNAPTCLAELITDDKYVVTARGLSNDATLDGNGRLSRGSEIWLQAILTPNAPLASNTGGTQ